MGMRAHTTSKILNNEPRPLSLHNNDHATSTLSKVSTEPVLGEHAEPSPCCHFDVDEALCDTPKYVESWQPSFSHLHAASIERDMHLVEIDGILDDHDDAFASQYAMTMPLPPSTMPSPPSEHSKELLRVMLGIVQFGAPSAALDMQLEGNDGKRTTNQARGNEEERQKKRAVTEDGERRRQERREEREKAEREEMISRLYSTVTTTIRDLNLVMPSDDDLNLESVDSRMFTNVLS